MKTSSFASRLLRLALSLSVLAGTTAAWSHESLVKALPATAITEAPVSEAAIAAFLRGTVTTATVGKGVSVKAHPALHSSQTVNLAPTGEEPLLADRLQVQTLDNGDFVWAGQVRGEPLSRVTLAVLKGQLSGVVDRPIGMQGNQVQLIEPQPDGSSLLLAGAEEPKAGYGCPEFKLPLLPGKEVGKFSEGWPVATAENPAVIDVMVLYTPASRVRYGVSGIESKILQAVAEANIAYRNSQVYASLNLVYMGEVAYAETGDIVNALVKLIGDGDGVMDEVHQIRNATHADLVSLVDEDNNYCGVSYQMGTPIVDFATYAFSVVSSGCLSYQTLAHEMGHNMGSGHDRNNGTGGSFPYSYGFQRCTMDPTGFRTIMAYPCNPGYGSRVNWFSNPNVSYNGYPMGVAYEANPAACSDNARSLNQTVHCVAAFRQAPAPLPEAPTSLAAQASAWNQINLTWQNTATTATSIRLERSLDGVAWVQIAELAATSVAYSDTGLAGTTSYSYRVRACNGTGCSDFSNVASATTPIAPPSAPANLVAVALSQTQVQLNWANACVRASTMRVERSTDQVNWSELVTLPAGSLAHLDASATAGSAYSYRVRACNDSGFSAYSAVASVTTLPPAPLAPANLAATAVSPTRVDLTWLNQATNAVSVRVERSTGAQAWVELAVLGAGVTAYSDTSAAATTSYNYRVRAANTGGFSAYSSVASVITPTAPPQAPTSLTATAVSSTQIRLTWQDNSSDETGFRVERSIGGAAYTVIATVGANVTTLDDTAVEAGQTCQYRVCACNSGGTSAASNVASATTPVPVPQAPAGLTATAISGTVINLTWQDLSSNETGYRLERSTDGITFALLATLAANVTGYSDTTVQPGQTCLYRVCAFNQGGDSAASATVGATTPITAPSAPSGLVATAVNGTLITLAWVDGSTTETGFRLERAVDGGSFILLATLGANVTSYADASVLPGQVCLYRVRAFNAGGESAASNVAQATTPVAPTVPSGFTATAVSSNQVRLTWTAATGNVSGYRLERSADGVVFTALTMVSAGTVTWLDTSVLPGRTYYYRCSAYGVGGESAWSGVASVITPIGAAPATPTSLAVSVLSSSSLKLTWKDAAKDEAGYYVERSVDGVNFGLVATLAVNAATFTDTGLNGATKYYYRVCAFRIGIQSPYTSIVSATTLMTPPSAPANLTAQAASKTQVNLAWQDTATNETGFKIERSTDGKSYSQVATVAAGVTTYANTGLSGGKTYYYRVRATNAGGDSAYSNVVTVATPK